MHLYSMQSAPLNLLKTVTHQDLTKFRFIQWMWAHNETFFFNEVTSMIELALDKKLWVRGFQPKRLWLDIAL